MHSDHANALLATHRVAETTNPKCTRIYMVGEYNRSTQPDTDELARRERFAAVAAAVATRKKDLPNGKKTMKSYLWSLELASYDQAHS